MRLRYLESVLVQDQGFLDMFVETKHAKLLARIQALKLRPIPPVLPLTRNGWLGDSPSWM